MKSNRDAWEAYASKYGTYSSSVYRSRLVMLIAENVLKEYPKKLPPEIRDRILPTIDAFGRLLLAGQTTTRGSPPEKQTSVGARPGSIKEKAEIEDEISSILTATFGLMFFEVRGEKKFDFSRTIHSNEVVMQVTYLEAFVRDTIAVICKLRPGVTKSAKQIGSFQERMNWFEHLGLDLKVAGTQIKWLEEAENVRHIMVHNGGRVDREFLRHTGRKGLSIGEPFPLIPHYLLRVYRGSTGFAATLFTEVAEKFFDISSLEGVVRLALLEKDALRHVANLFSATRARSRG